MAPAAADPAEFSLAVSAATLRAAIAQPEDPVRAKLAFKHLVELEGGLSVEEAAAVLLERRSSDELRAAAAVELGRLSPTRAEPALIKALGDAEPALLRHVARSLGLVGGAEAREALRRVQDLQGPAAGAVEFAISLISYRLGDRERLIEPPRLVRPAPRGELTVPLEFRPITSEEATRRQKDLQRAVPADGLDAESGLRFVCGASEHWILLAKKVVRAETLAKVLSRPLVVGAILKYRVCSDRYTLDEYLLGNGDRDQGSTILGVRPSGSVVHAGTARIEGSSARFELGSAIGPYARPVRLEGRFDQTQRHLAFGMALIGDVEPGAEGVSRPRPRRR